MYKGYQCAEKFRETELFVRPDKNCTFRLAVISKQAVQQFLPKGKEADVISAIESKLGYKETIKFLHSIGKGLAESDAAGLGSNNAGAPAKSLAERMYGAR